jgi:predicted acetyltransferase
MKKNKLIGYIGLHPMFEPHKNDLQIRVFLSPNERGKNYSVMAMENLLVMKKKGMTQKNIWCISKTTNIPSNKMAIKSGGIFIKTIKIGDGKYNIYTYK